MMVKNVDIKLVVKTAIRKRLITDPIWVTSPYAKKQILCKKRRENHQLWESNPRVTSAVHFKYPTHTNYPITDLNLHVI